MVAKIYYYRWPKERCVKVSGKTILEVEENAQKLIQHLSLDVKVHKIRIEI